MFSQPSDGIVIKAITTPPFTLKVREVLRILMLVFHEYPAVPQNPS